MVRFRLACVALLLFGLLGEVVGKPGVGKPGSDSTGQTQGTPFTMSADLFPAARRSTKLACASALTATPARQRLLQVDFQYPDNVTWHGGEVMVNTVRVILIFVGFPKDGPMVTTLTHFTKNVGASDWWRTVTRYYGYPFGGPKPPNAKPKYASGKLNVVEPWFLNKPGVPITSDSTTDIIRMIRHATQVASPRGWKVDVTNDMYVLITSKKQYSFNCKGTCGIHSNTTFGTKYAFVPEGCCELSSSEPTFKLYTKKTAPYGPLIDRMVDTLGHELVEMLTSPSDKDGGTGWWDDSDGLENADKCQNTYGKLSLMKDPVTGRQVVYNHIIGGKPYVLQPQYDVSINPKTKQQWGCVSGVDKKGKVILLPTE